jgi:Tfp pilus assembly protein FimV
MSFFNRLSGRLQTGSTDSLTDTLTSAPKDPLVGEITELACGIARSCAALRPEAAEDALADVVAGRINAALSQRTQHLTEQALKAQLEVARAREQEKVADAAADASDHEADALEDSGELKANRAREERERVRTARTAIQELPLMARIRTPWYVVALAVVGSATVVAALARLALVGVDEVALKWVIAVGAGCVALAAELVIGTLGADAYERIPEELIRWVIPVVLTLVIGLITGTEVLAAKVRQEGLEAAHAFKAGAGGAAGGGPLAPSLIWTGPLAILATITGSGTVGLGRVKDSRRTRFDEMDDAKSRLKAAETAVKQDEAKAKELRQHAIRRREQAAQLRGTASTAQAQSDSLAATVRLSSERHAELIRAIMQQAKLAYRIEAERYSRTGDAPAVDVPAHEATLARALSLTLGGSILAGVLVTLVTASVIPGLIVGSVVMMLAAVRSTRAAQ